MTTTAPSPTPHDEGLRQMARLLAPYIAEELGLASVATDGATVARAPYDAAECAQYAAALSVGTLQRAEQFFGALAEHGRIDALQLAELLGLTSSRAIAGALTNSLKQAARKVGAGVPWDETSNADDRTVWLDRGDISTRMGVAIADELKRRTGTV